MEVIIKNIDDLKSAIYHLKVAEDQQKYAIRQRFNRPSAIFATIASIFSKPAGVAGEKSENFFKQDILAMISRFIVPFTLNKTLFRKSNFIVKSLVGVLSQRASKYINEDSVSGVWSKIKSFFPQKSPAKTRKILIAKAK